MPSCQFWQRWVWLISSTSWSMPGSSVLCVLCSRSCSKSSPFTHARSDSPWFMSACPVPIPHSKSEIPVAMEIGPVPVRQSSKFQVMKRVRRLIPREKILKSKASYLQRRKRYSPSLIKTRHYTQPHTQTCYSAIRWWCGLWASLAVVSSSWHAWACSYIRRNWLVTR